MLPLVSDQVFLDFQYSEDMKHKTTLLELQKMFTYLMVCLKSVKKRGEHCQSIAYGLHFQLPVSLDAGSTWGKSRGIM